MATEETQIHTPTINPEKAQQSKKRARENAAEPTPFKKQKKSRDPAIAPVKAQDELEDVHPREKPKKVKKARREEKTIPTEDSIEGLVIAQAQEGDISHTRRQTWSDQELSNHSPFVKETMSFYITLSPVAYHSPLEGACAEHISPLLLTYYPPLDGIVLSYDNPRLSEDPDMGAKVSSHKEVKKLLGKSMDEYGVTYVWLTADFLLFRPDDGVILEGYVNLQNEGVLGLLCYNYFNAGIEKSRLCKEWKWSQNEKGLQRHNGGVHEQQSNYFVDEDGRAVDGRIVFKAKGFQAGFGSDGVSGSVNISGTILSDEDDVRVGTVAQQHAVDAT